MSYRVWPAAQQTAGPRVSISRLAAWSLGALLVTACGNSAPEESGVRTVEASIEGITCPTCVPPLEAALRRQFEEAEAIVVDDDRDVATVQLNANQAFSAKAFHAAVEQVRMRVVDLRIKACGRIEAKDNQRWLTAGASRFLIQGNDELPLNQPLCVDGRLDASRDPVTLDATDFTLQRP